ncbi:MAG: hypothetical protein JXB10_11880 [Pirellulales bacterium]|nr:hypothetical protein [Pirellulales bacterium]
MQRFLSLPSILVAALLLSGSAGWGAGPPPAGGAPEAAEKATPPGPAEQLSAEQQRIAEKFRRLEQVLARMKELSAGADPRRAALLEKAYKQSKNDLIDVQFETLVTLLKNDQIARSLKNQADLEGDLKSLLDLLMSENRSKRIASEKARIRQYLRELNTIIQREKDVQGRTAGGDDAKRLAREQGDIAQKTGELSKTIKNQEEGKAEGGKGKTEESKADGGKQKGEGEKAKGQGKESRGGSPSSGKGQGEKSEEAAPPEGHPARQRLDAARRRMQEAEQKLRKAQREGAANKQEEALRELEQAKAEFERILRQLREEEIGRMLVLLEARFRKMLEMQQDVYEGTLRLDKVPAAQRTHNHEIEASRLSNKELQIVVEADKALLLLKEDGTAVALPEAVEQMRDDMQQVVHRLAQVKADAFTQSIEQDVISALDEIINALKKAQKESANRNRPPRSSPSGNPADEPLVDTLAELRMIRALQMRVNRRTLRYGKLISGEQAENADLIDALKRLAERERKIYRVTHDLQSGKNQ